MTLIPYVFEGGADQPGSALDAYEVVGEWRCERIGIAESGDEPF